MFKKIKTNTGMILVDKENTLECLYVGDYGRENNIKADFLGLTKEIDTVVNTPVDLDEKMVVTISTQKGCPMNCMFCDCPFVPFKGNCSLADLTYQVRSAIKESGCSYTERFNLHFARMGEPSFNQNVLEFAKILPLVLPSGFKSGVIHPVVSTMLPKSNKNLIPFIHDWCDIKNITYKGEAGIQFSINTLDDEARNKMFDNKSLGLQEISDLAKSLPMPVGRKYTLNFAVTSSCDLDPVKMNALFDKKKFIVKITPIHETRRAVDNSYEIIKDFDVYSKFERPLVEAGWDVIVFVPSIEEDADRITCGNALLREVNEVKLCQQ